jgi:O-antigen/teichoic acid export membrane protein
VKANHNVKFGLVGLEKIWQLVAGLLTLKILSGYLGVSEFGIYQNATAVLVIATAATWLCPAEVLAGKFDGTNDLPKGLFQTIFVLRIVISLVIYLTIAALTPMLYGADPRRYLLILLLCFSVVHVEPAGLLKFRLEAEGFLGRLSVLRMSTSVARLIAMKIATSTNAPTSAMIALLAAEQVINSLAYYAFYIQQIGPLSIGLQFDRAVAIDTLKTGSRYWLGFVLMYCYLKFDRLFFSLRLPTDDFGIYTAGANMAEQVNSLGLMLVAVLAPAAVYAKTKVESVDSFRKFVLAISGIGFAVAVLAYWLAPLIIDYIFGAKYDKSLLVFQALVLLSPLAYLDAASSVLLFKFEKRRVFVLKSLTAFAVMAITTVYLLPVLGWRAAAMGNGAALLVNLLINYRFYKKISSELVCQKRSA